MKRIAIVATVYRYLSHAQHIGDRFLVGYPRDGAWHKPDMKVVSLYVDQKPDGDQSAARAKEFDFQVYPTIRRSAAVRRQRTSPSMQSWSSESTATIRGTTRGRSCIRGTTSSSNASTCSRRTASAVPLYNDKHLSFSFEKAKWMVDASKRLKFPMLAGSSLPVTWRLPDIELPLNARSRAR